MAWLYLPASVDSNWESNSQSRPTEHWFTSSAKPIVRPISSRDLQSANRQWVKLLLPQRQSGTTSSRSTQNDGLNRLISSARAGRVPTSVWRAPERGSTESEADSGARSLAAFARWDQTSSCWKTPQRSLFADWTEFSVTWPNAGTMRHGMCFQREAAGLTAAERHTSGGGSSFSRNEYPTPSASRYGTSQNEGKVSHFRPSAGTPSLDTWAKTWPTPNARDWKDSGETQGARKSPNLGTIAAQKEAGHSPLKPTATWIPCVCEAGVFRCVIHKQHVHDCPCPPIDQWETDPYTEPIPRHSVNRSSGQGWPTPTAGDAKSSGAAGYSTASGRHSGTTLTDAASGARGPLAQTTTTDGATTSTPEGRPQLSANFVEALMGFPPGWSIATIGSGPSETQFRQYVQRWRSELSQLVSE